MFVVNELSSLSEVTRSTTLRTCSGSIVLWIEATPKTRSTNINSQFLTNIRDQTEPSARSTHVKTQPLYVSVPKTAKASIEIGDKRTRSGGRGAGTQADGDEWWRGRRTARFSKDRDEAREGLNNVRNTVERKGTKDIHI